MVNLSPIRHAIGDHQGAFELVSQSRLDWSIVACPAILDGPERGVAPRHRVFPGGFERVHPGDVASAIVDRLDSTHSREMLGIWC